MESKTFRVPSIHCDHCVQTIEREVGALPGVTSVWTDAASKSVTVSWEEAVVDWERIRGLLTELEFAPAE
ncbi:MAG: heavy-metal-associated domain-containing protein [Candidatus Eiseniibacteriota bacterium]